VYPNPGAQWIKVELPQGLTASLSLTDARGRTLRSIGNSSAFLLDVQDLPAATYVLRIQDEHGKSWVKKWIKQ